MIRTLSSLPLTIIYRIFTLRWGRITRQLTLKYSKRFEYLISGISRTLEFGWTLLKIIRNLRRARQVSRLSIPFGEILVTDRDLHFEEKRQSILPLPFFIFFIYLFISLFFFFLSFWLTRPSRGMVDFELLRVDSSLLLLLIYIRDTRTTSPRIKGHLTFAV